jgi:hypothetical protein
MARPSKLSERQWAEIEKRLLDGEKPSSLATEYGIDRAAITRKFSQPLRNIKSVANQIVKTEESLKSLTVAQQVQAISLASKLRSITDHLLGAAEFGAMTSHRLSGLANTEVQKIDDVNPLESIEALKGVSALTRLANDSAEIGLNLLKANKEAIDNLNKSDDKPEPKQIIFSVIDASA